MPSFFALLDAIATLQGNQVLQPPWSHSQTLVAEATGTMFGAATVVGIPCASRSSDIGHLEIQYMCVFPSASYMRTRRPVLNSRFWGTHSEGPFFFVRARVEPWPVASQMRTSPPCYEHVLSISEVVSELSIMQCHLYICLLVSPSS